MVATNKQLPDTTAFFIAFQSLVKQAVYEALSEQKQTSDPEPTKLRAPATRNEAAKFLSLSLPTLDSLIRTEQLKAFNVGRQVRIDWNELEAFIKNKGGK